MIRIYRTHPAPAGLVRNGSRQTERDCAAYDQSPSDYRDGTKHFDDRDYYRSDEVKDALLAMHHGKCCYCEKRSERRELQVEHFRPKGAVRQSRGVAEERPGYFWLAYSWENLFLACAACNGKKGTTFPLRDPGQRARSHHDDLALEEADLVNPAEDDPRDHIYFEKEIPRHRTPEGQRTIEVLCLRRDDLRELRFSYLQKIEQLRFMLGHILNQDDANQFDRIQEVARTLWEAMQENAKFSAMVKDLFGSADSLLEHIQHSVD